MFRVKIWIKVPVYRDFKTPAEAEEYLDWVDGAKTEEVFDANYSRLEWDEAEAEGDFV